MNGARVAGRIRVDQRREMDPKASGGHRCQMTSLVLTGAAGPVADVIVAALADSGRFTSVRAVTRVEKISGADAVVHLGAPIDSTDPYDHAPGALVAQADAVLHAAVQAGVGHVVVVSSALVYGALAANAVPLTENAPIHPGFMCRPAVELAEIERALVTWRTAHPDIVVTTLRCAPVVADGHPGWLGVDLHRALTVQAEGLNPESQYVHADDVAAAIMTVLDAKVAGVRNVAPDGWLTGAQRQALENRPRVRVPEPIARRAAGLRGRLSGSPAANGMVDYVRYPWVVANDRLRSDGWEPTIANDEAYVAAFKPAPWAMVSPTRRQELALGAAGVTIAGAVATTVWAVTRRRR